MAEFITMTEAEDKFGSKGKTNAALALGIVGTALGAGLLGNNSCCGNGGGLLSNLFGNNGNCCLADALKSELKARGGFTIGRIRFNDSDIDELVSAFNQAKQKNIQ